MFVCVKYVFEVLIAILAGPPGWPKRDGWKELCRPLRASPDLLPAQGATQPVLRAYGCRGGRIREALTAGGGGDGAVQIGQAAGRRVPPDGDREAEDELRRRGGSGLAPLAQRPRRAGGLHRAGRGQHLRLELQQLPHEAEVGRDDAPPLLHELEGLLEPHALLHHQVGQADGGRARDAGLAVHQHAPAAVLHRIWGRERRTVSGAQVPIVPGRRLQAASAGTRVRGGLEKRGACG